ncbi:MAG: hypothetical protein ACOCTG_01780 [Bacteroidota bacterium]
MPATILIVLALSACVDRHEDPGVRLQDDETDTLHTFTTYRDHEAGFEIEYPDRLLFPTEPSGEGAQQFVSDEGFLSLSVESRRRISDADVDLLLEDLRRRRPTAQLDSVERRVGHLTAYGREGPSMFVERAIVDPDTIYVLEMEYPAALHDALDPVRERIIESFRRIRTDSARREESDE